MAVTFAPAHRQSSHLIITAYGHSGCGKTLSLLRLGRGLAGPSGKLGMIDTETGRGSHYSNSIPGSYLYAELPPPFTPERYIEALDDAEKAGIEVLVLDSGSHEWEGLGGILEIADAAGGDGLAKWARPKARHKKYIQRLLRSRMHILIGLRAKEKLIYEPDPEKPGKQRIISDGDMPIQDKRFIYETTVQLYFPTTGDRGVPLLKYPQFKCIADLIPAFHEGGQITEETGSRIAALWSGKPLAERAAGGTPSISPGREPAIPAGPLPPLGEADIDALRDDLNATAESKAGEGTAEFRDWWSDLPRHERDLIRGMLARYKGMAREADDGGRG